MSSKVDWAAQLFGGDIRKNVLGVLAESMEPKTGYEISKILGIYPSKVYKILRSLQESPLVDVLAESNRKRYLLVDEDLRKVLLRCVRIAAESDWFAGRRWRMKEAENMVKDMPILRLPGSSVEPAKRVKVILREFERPREKDAILDRMGLRTATRAVKRKVRD